MTDNEPSITVYADYVCPFCYLGRRSLEGYRTEREAPLPVDWRPFDLRRHKRGPDGEIDDTVDDGKDEAYFEQVRGNVARLKQAYGADSMLAIDALPEGVDSYRAQLASLHVKENHPARWDAFDAAIYEALWVEGRDIGDREVLVDLAENVGIAAAAIRSALEDEPRRRALEDAFEAAQRRGVTGVPTFVFDGTAARGAVPPAHLRRLVEDA